jgi:DNA-binding transcriptional regulator LsrR (DeoR family)
LKEKFGLKDVFVVITNHRNGERLTRTLGNAGAKMLKLSRAQKTSGVGMGHFDQRHRGCVRSVAEPMPVKVVQLVGAMGAHNMEYDGHDLVARITEKLGRRSLLPERALSLPNR